MRVLVIDDQASVRAVVRRMLEQADHEVIEAENGKDGLKLFQEQLIDVVITDIIMPEQEGIETIIALRKIASRPLRIVVMSGGGRLQSKDILPIAVKFGADAALPKPFLKEELVACVEGRSTGSA